jgi:hypothetical protein
MRWFSGRLDKKAKIVSGHNLQRKEGSQVAQSYMNNICDSNRGLVKGSKHMACAGFGGHTAGSRDLGISLGWGILHKLSPTS